MKREINHSLFGKIVYNENFWTGKKSVSINGKPLQKISKTTFKYVDDNNEESYVNLVGNIFKGVCLKFKDRHVVVSSATKWYEYVFAVLPFALIMVWGNSAALCNIIPVVGGAIGGAISGLLGFSSVIVMKETKNVFVKILIGILFLAITFAVCTLIGYAIVGLIS